MYYRPSLTTQAKMDSNNSFEIHTWMIARLTEKSGLDVAHLCFYVVAVCYEKMITRMTYRVSRSFRDALKNLPPTFEYPEKFPKIGGSNELRFIEFLLKHKDRLELHTPIDKLVKHREDLYNKETYADFHSILCEILELFLKSLMELKVMHHNLGGKAPSSTQLIDTKAKIDFIAVVGTLLRLLVKSKAIKRCLYSIVKFLPDRAAGVKAKVDNKTDDDDDDDKHDEDEDEDGGYKDDEDELEGDEEEDGGYKDDEEDEGGLEGDEEEDEEGPSGASIKLDPKPQACLKSLNLAVVYIDAILVLSKFVKNSAVDVKIKITVLQLIHPRKVESMLPWKALLQNETYFPGKPSPSAEEIVEFLESRSNTDNQMSSQDTTDNQKSSKKGGKSRKKVQKSSKLNASNEVSPESVTAELGDLRRNIRESNLEMDTFTTKIDKVVDSLTKLEFSHATPGSMKYIQSIIKQLKSAKGLYMDKLEIDVEIDEIMEMLRTLADNTRLERMLQKGSPLDTGVGFKGTLHAEACIAAHCTFSDHEWLSPVSCFLIIFGLDLLILLVV